MTTPFKSRFGGISRLYGKSNMDFIAKAHVAVVGIGGVGSWAAEALARSGVGKITLIDMDDVCISNTNRQIHALSGTIGQSKVGVMAERLRQINPECCVVAIDDFLTAETLNYLPDDLNYVIDAIDSVKHKAAMIHHCCRRKIPIICAGGAGGQTDPTTVSIQDLSKTFNDPLLAKVRSTLRRYYGFSKNPKRRFGVRCVYSTQQINYPQPDGTVCHQKAEPDDDQARRGAPRLDCEGGLGASVCVTATFGLVAVSFALQKIVEKGVRQEQKREND